MGTPSRRPRRRRGTISPARSRSISRAISNSPLPISKPRSSQPSTDTPEAPVEPTATTEAPVEPTEPTTEGFTIGLVALDPDNNVVPGACYSLDGGAAQCDDDGDGAVTFSGVAAGSHTATMTQAPAGFANVGSLGVDVQGDQQFAVRLTPSETPGEGTGTIAASVADENGDLIPGACFEIVGIDQDCDGDDEDALMTQPDVPVGYLHGQPDRSGWLHGGRTDQPASNRDGRRDHQRSVPGQLAGRACRPRRQPKPSSSRRPPNPVSSHRRPKPARSSRPKASVRCKSS